MNRLQQVRERIAAQPCVIDAHTHVGIDPRAYRERAYPYCLSFRDLVGRMDQQGVEASVVFPFFATECLPVQDCRVTHEPTLHCRFPYELENRSLFHEIYVACNDVRDRALPFVIVDPARCVEEQIALIRELDEQYGVFGLKACTTYIRSEVREFLRGGQALLRLAEERDWPLILHSATDPSDPYANVADVLAVAQETPRVRVAVAHTARFHRATLDAVHALPNGFVDTSAFGIHCILACREDPILPPAGERFAADYREPAQTLAELAQAYPGTIVWGSDQPFDSFLQDYQDASGRVHHYDLRSSVGGEKELLDTLPGSLRQEVAWATTVRFLFGPDTI